MIVTGSGCEKCGGRGLVYADDGAPIPAHVNNVTGRGCKPCDHCGRSRLSHDEKAAARAREADAIVRAFDDWATTKTADGNFGKLAELMERARRYVEAK